MIDIEQCALGALEQDALAGTPLLVEEVPGDIHEGQELWCDLNKFPHQVVGGNLRFRETAAQGVVVCEDALNFRAERIEGFEILHSDGAAPDLVFIGRSDAASGGANFAATGGFLAQLVEFAVRI